jgi:hypothetical protein
MWYCFRAINERIANWILFGYFNISQCYITLLAIILVIIQSVLDFFNEGELTPCSTDLVENLTVAELISNSPSQVYYRVHNYLPVLLVLCQMTVLKYRTYIFSTFTLILSFHIRLQLSSNFLLSRFMTETVSSILISFICEQVSEQNNSESLWAEVFWTVSNIDIIILVGAVLIALI